MEGNSGESVLAKFRSFILEYGERSRRSESTKGLIQLEKRKSDTEQRVTVTGRMSKKYSGRLLDGKQCGVQEGEESENSFFLV